MKLKWHGSIRNIGGYQKANSNLLLALKKMKHEIELIPDEFDTINVDLIKMSQHKLNSDSVPVVYFTPPERERFGKINGHPQIGYTMIECDNITDDWANKINKMDHLIVPSLYVYKAFAKKVKIPMHVCPLGFDDKLFSKDVPPITGLPDGKIKFLTVTEVNDRKNLDILVDAFDKAFKDRQDVVLVLKIFVNNNDRHLLERLTCHNNSKVRVIEQFYRDNELAALYRAADVYISVANEGFNLPLLEAIGSGIPAISLSAGGHMEFSNNNVLVDCKDVPAKSKNPIYNGFNWFVPDEKDLIKKLRENCFYKSQRQDVLGNSYNLIRDKYNWNAVAKNFTSILEEITNAS